MGMKKNDAAQSQYSKKHSLAYISRLTKVEKSSIYRASNVLLAPSLRANFQTYLEDVVLDRLVRAQACLKLAKRLTKKHDGKPPDEESLRCAVGRAYYSAHHLIRAIVLHELHYDPDGHQESIEVFDKLLSNKKFRDRSGLTRRTADKIAEAKDNRSVADYSPYDISRQPNTESWILITGNDWQKAAGFNIRLAERVLRGAYDMVG